MKQVNCAEGKKKAKGVYEHPKCSGFYWIRYTDAEGKKRRQKAGTFAVACKLVESRRAAVWEHRVLPPSRPKKVTFKSICDEAVEVVRATLSKSYADDLAFYGSVAATHFGDVNAQSITKMDVIQFLHGEEKNRKLAANSYNSWRNALSKIFHVANESGRLTNNPVSTIKTKKGISVVRFLSRDEERRLREAIEKGSLPPFFLALFTVSINTGARMGEQLAIRWEHVDTRNKLVTLINTKTKTIRHVSLNPEALQAFSELRSLRSSNSPWVFPQSRKPEERLTTVGGLFRKVLKAAGICRFTWHCNRHTFASRLAMAGVDIRTIAELLGHASLRSTMRYAHLSPAYVGKAVLRLADYDD